jgi:ABC-2 type transport system ATP-binding protein
MWQGTFVADQAIRIRGLRKAYAETTAVDGLDLDVERGEIFALLGPNGAGKSTTVEILEGFRSRDAGEVAVLGEDPGRRLAAWRARIGIVLQSANDLQEITVGEAVRHFAAYYPTPRDPEEVISRVGLTEKASSKVRQLSGGQRRRLDVALGVIGRPDLLFLDEPTTGFDPEARRRFWELIRDLSREGTTILLTTHYLDEAEALASRVGVIAAGRIVEVGDASTLGGRADAQSIVSWQQEGRRRVEHTDTPTALVAALAARFGGEVPGLSVVRPSLEDVYLRLIGESQ